jgi:predicted transcriptional regulator
MVTSIQLNNNVKKLLDNMKETGKETYEEVILQMMRQLEQLNRKRKDLIAEGYKEMASESLKISEEFESLENFEEWEW